MGRGVQGTGRPGGVAGFPRGGASRAAGGTHHGHGGRRPAGAAGRAGGLRSRSSRGGRGRGPGRGAGAGPGPGAALGFWLRMRKGARERCEGKARAAPGSALRSPMPPPPSCRRRRAHRPFRTVAPPPPRGPRPPPPPPRARGRRRPVPVTPRPAPGRPPPLPRPGNPLAHEAHSWLDGHRYPARVEHTFPTQDGAEARTAGPLGTSPRSGRGRVAAPRTALGRAPNTDARTPVTKTLTSPRSRARRPGCARPERHTHTRQMNYAPRKTLVTRPQTPDHKDAGKRRHPLQPRHSLPHTHAATQVPVMETAGSATCPVMGTQRGPRTHGYETLGPAVHTEARSEPRAHLNMRAPCKHADAEHMFSQLPAPPAPHTHTCIRSQGLGRGLSRDEADFTHLHSHASDIHQHTTPRPQNLPSTGSWLHTHLNTLTQSPSAHAHTNLCSQ